ncbi:MAG: DUF4876 domain-containing protein [Fidelibacterota bacterium]
MVKKLTLTLFAIGMFLTGFACFREQPDFNDGNLSIGIYVKLKAEFYGIDEYLDSTEVTLSTIAYNIPERTAVTDSGGFVRFEGLVWANYYVKGLREGYPVPTVDGFEIATLRGAQPVVPDNEVYVDTLYLTGPQPPGIKINELYTCGPPNNFFYYSDQYFELYNSSAETLYLDGIQFCRMGIGLDNVTYIFQFPGEPVTGREYPIYPGQFVVCARTAFNHRQYVFNNRTSVDLSHADWEFVNESDPTDYDNPDVPNIGNILDGHYRDFSVNLIGDVILIADGSDDNYLDGIDIHSVIDCVEYSQDPDHIKEIGQDLDYGYTGIGMMVYSGKSIERRKPGFDTNNSTIDFEIIDAPTVGYQHGE